MWLVVVPACVAHLCVSWCVSPACFLVCVSLVCLLVCFLLCVSIVCFLICFLVCVTWLFACVCPLCVLLESIIRKNRPNLTNKHFVHRHKILNTHHLIFSRRQIASLLETLSYSSCKNSYKQLEQTRISPNQSQRYFLLDPVQMSVTFPTPTAGCYVCLLS
jgi:hypothetical protein